MREMLNEKKDVQRRLDIALTELANEQDEMLITKEELRQLAAVEEGKTMENEHLVAYIIKNVKKMQEFSPSTPGANPDVGYLLSKDKFRKANLITQVATVE